MNLGTPLAAGNTAILYLVENKIIKIFNDDLPETVSSFEATKQKIAYDCGLSVPKVLDVTKIDGKQAIVMEYIKGKTLGELFFENQEKAEYYLDIAVDIQQKVHQVSVDSIEKIPDKLRRQIEAVEQLDQHTKSGLIRKLDTMPTSTNLCHGDFHLFNLIWSENRIAILDWADASAGDMKADVYRSYLLYTQFSQELADLYLQTFCKKSGMLKDEIFQWAPIIAAARLSENLPAEHSEHLLEIIHHSL